MLKLKFRVMVTELVGDVFIAGSFNGSQTQETNEMEDWVPYTMTKDTEIDNVYTIEILVMSDRSDALEYKFINGYIWEDFEMNRGVKTYKPTVQPIQEFNQYDSEYVAVTFNARISGGVDSYSKCYLVGTMNGWNLDAIKEMNLSPTLPDCFTITLPLRKCKTYSYKFLTDSTWSSAELRQDRNIFVPDHDMYNMIEEFDSDLIIDKILMDKTVFLENMFEKINTSSNNIQQTDYYLHDQIRELNDSLVRVENELKIISQHILHSPSPHTKYDSESEINQTPDSKSIDSKSESLDSKSIDSKSIDSKSESLDSKSIDSKSESLDHNELKETMYSEIVEETINSVIESIVNQNNLCLFNEVVATMSWNIRHENQAFVRYIDISDSFEFGKSIPVYDKLSMIQDDYDSIVSFPFNFLPSKKLTHLQTKIGPGVSYITYSTSNDCVVILNGVVRVPKETQIVVEEEMTLDVYIKPSDEIDFKIEANSTMFFIEEPTIVDSLISIDASLESIEQIVDDIFVPKYNNCYSKHTITDTLIKCLSKTTLNRLFQETNGSFDEFQKILNIKYSSKHLSNSDENYNYMHDQFIAL